MIINLILRFKGIDGVDKFLGKHRDYFKDMDALKTIKFMQKYLDFDYQIRKSDFSFLDYLDNSMVESRWYPVLIKNSKCFKTMTDIDKVYLLNDYLDSKGSDLFIRESLMIIFQEEALRILMDSESLIAKFPNIFAKKLLESGNIDLVIESRKCPSYLMYYLNEYINNYFPLKDIKKYLLNYSNYNEATMQVLTSCWEHGSSNKEEVLRVISEIIIEKCIEKKKNQTKIEEIDTFLNNLINGLIGYKEEVYSKKDLDLIARLLEESGNKEAVMYFLTHTICSYNYEIIDKIMLNFDNLPMLFNAVDKFYVNYITTRILLGYPKVVKHSFVSYISKHYSLFSVMVLDKILFLAYTCAYMFDKEEIMGFLKAGSSYIKDILYNYTFSDNERFMIVEKYKNLGMEDLGEELKLKM